MSGLYHSYVNDGTNILNDTVSHAVPPDSNDVRCQTKQKRHSKCNFRFKNGNGLKMAHLNVRSILPKIEQLRIMTQQSGVDILAVCETWLDSNILDFEIRIPNYELLRHDRNRHGGGVALYIRNGLEFKPRFDINEGFMLNVYGLKLNQIILPLF